MKFAGFFVVIKMPLGNIILLFIWYNRNVTVNSVKGR